MSSWWPGEKERAAAFYELRKQRIDYRATVLMPSLEGDPIAYEELFDCYAALLRRNPVEEEFEDTCPPTNQNLW